MEFAHIHDFFTKQSRVRVDDDPWIPGLRLGEPRGHDMRTAEFPAVEPGMVRRRKEDTFSRTWSREVGISSSITNERGKPGKRNTKITTGMVIDRKYRVLGSLGAGGFGCVYLVEHVFLGQRFAMKLLNNEISSDPAWVERFHREARATSLIGHEGIVFVTDFGHADGIGYYFVMEHLLGETLELHMHQMLPMDLGRVVRLVLAISSALAAVHDIGIVHCDLKPSNLIITQRGDGAETPKILDFGVSSHVTGNQGKIFGTPLYMAPEQTISMKVDRRADQFSLAVILYELVTGRRPWNITRWEDASPWERDRNAPKPPSFYMRDGNPEIDGVIMRALEIDPVRRWPDIQSFAWGLAMASGIEWSALPDPWDRAGASIQHRSQSSRRARRSLPLAPVIEVTEPSTGIESMMVYIDSLGLCPDTQAFDDFSFDEPDLFEGPILSVHFRTSERLRREWRRNLLAGALFAQGDLSLSEGSEIGVRLIYEPLHRELLVHGVITGVMNEPETHGVSIRFDEASRSQLYGFIKSLKLGLGYRAEDVITPLRTLREDDDLSVEEAFVFTRIIGGTTTVAATRQLSIGLSLEVDHVLGSLVQKGLLIIKPRGLPVGVPVQNEPPSAWLRSCVRTQRVRTLSKKTREAIEETLAKVEYFISMTNYLAAINILYKSLELFPTEAQLYYRLGMLYAQFEQDFERAQQLLETAIRIDPVERRYHMALEYLDTLMLSSG